ncbi:cytochrome c [Bradyrhizobium sp. Arg68]|uniref:c-type cytochrome n=1 Tax=Bradyrhizobium ivorense TaxID=2511166 RepID=UPI001E2CF7F1|nr:cytochrome c [Bradyrhizobium ivorense]MCC8936952.1 cytochrome c [Bradyrhizobium ivorense]
MRRRNFGVALLAAAIVIPGAATQAAERYGIGRAATPAEIAGWDIDIGRDGANLPPGSGSVARGRIVFGEQCASCHGDSGQGGVGDRLVGGQGTLASPKPIRTIGSYWPYASTLFDYVRRAMPQNAPQSLSNEDVYAVSAYLLSLNGIVPDNAVLDARSLGAIKMPNRDGFVADPRPDVHNR